MAHSIVSFLNSSRKKEKAKTCSLKDQGYNLTNKIDRPMAMKILIVRIGRLGDIVMILPAIAEIQRQYPNSDIYALTSQDGIRLLKAYGLNPDNIHCYNNQFLKRPHQVRKVQDFLEYHQFDKVFCFEHKDRTVSWLPSESTIIDDSHADKHYALRCLKLVNSQPDPIKAEPYLPASNYDIAPQLNQYDINPDTILIGLHPTYSGFNKWGRSQEKNIVSGHLNLL